MAKSGNQTIKCDVTECVHHSFGDVCSLNSIIVSSTPAHPSVECADESMCASFERTNH